MKRLFICVLCYYWLMAVGIELCWYLLTGEFVHVYGTDSFYCPDEYYFEAAYLLSEVLFLGMIAIYLMPSNPGRIHGVINNKYNWYYFFIGCTLIVSKLIVRGGAAAEEFNLILAGAYNGTLGAYSSFFIDLQTLFVIQMMCINGKIGLWKSCIIYVVHSWLGFSRAGGLYCFYILICKLSSFNNINSYRKSIKAIIMLLIVVSPIMYMVATYSRGHRVGDSMGETARKIVSRCSRLELAGIPLHGLQNGDYLYDADMFRSKFSLNRQLQLCINSMVPGDVFPDDVQPNQYYRSIFLGISKEFAHDNYTSINMTFPIYISLKYGACAAVLISVAVIVGLYLISNNFLIRYSIGRAIPIMVLLDILDYFDWVYIMQRCMAIVCTILLFKMIRSVRIIPKYYLNRSGEWDAAREI